MELRGNTLSVSVHLNCIQEKMALTGMGTLDKGGAMKTTRYLPQNLLIIILL